MGPSDP